MLLVRAGAAVERVVPVATVQTVVSCSTGERVLPAAAADRVVAAATVDHVVATATDDDVVPGGPVKVVRPRCADDGGGLPVAGGGPRGCQGRMRQDQPDSVVAAIAMAPTFRTTVVPIIMPSLAVPPWEHRQGNRRDSGTSGRPIGG